MRVVHVTILAVSALLVGGVASAQGLGDAAAREKQRRQSEETTQGKVYTEDDLGPSMAPVAVPQTLPASAEEGSSAEDAGEDEASPETSSADEQRAQAEAAWRQRLEQARQEADVYQDVINKLQQELNNVYSGGMYTSGRASKAAFLEENQRLLAETQKRIADLEAEGRRNNYR
jgi:hypothetical protein